jgi:hypothetical protein
MDQLQSKIESTVNNELAKISEILIQRCNEAVQEAFSAFAAELVAKCGIEAYTIEEIWSESCSQLPLNLTKASVKQEKREGPKDGCVAVLQRGKNAGNRCGSRPKDGGKYCSRHAHLAEKGDEEGADGADTPKTKKTVTKTTKTPAKKTTNKNTNPTLRYNTKIRHFVHAESGLVLDADRKTIVGRYVDNEVRPLSGDDLKEAEKHGFKIGKPETTEEKCEEEAEEETEEEPVEEETEETESPPPPTKVVTKKPVRCAKKPVKKTEEVEEDDGRAGSPDVEELAHVKHRVNATVGDSRTAEVQEVLSMFGYHDSGEDEDLDEE